ncbi:MAG: hypothetical protein LBS45_08260 [Synergistaceae bacterium]|jgi:hypothetical protein|nr:hypothetical protein [Synergistaceae bacterium]
MGKYIKRRAAVPNSQKAAQNFSKFFTALVFLAALVQIALFPTTGAASDETPLDSLVLNEGGSLALRVERDDPARLCIESGVAKRVPRKERIPFDIGKKIVELDIDTKAISLGTGAKQITLSGPVYAMISGIDAGDWGTSEVPAIFMDRDCRLVLLGKAQSSAVIRVNPLARVTIDARKFASPEIKIIGGENNANVSVAAAAGTNVAFLHDDTPMRIVTMRGWYGGATGTPPSPPTPPGVQSSPQGTPPPPPGTGSTPPPDSGQTGQNAPPAIPGVTQQGGAQ